MSMTRQSPHIFSRSSAAPWNIECPASLPSMASIALSVPKGLLQRTQAGHSMFQGEALERLKMCGDCRVIDLYSASNETRITDL